MFDPRTITDAVSGFSNIGDAGGMFPEALKFGGGPSGGGNYWGDLLGGLGKSVRGFDWGSLAKGLTPAIAGAGMEMLGRAMFPGEPTKVLGVDPRTAEGTKAEQTRLGTAEKMSASLNDPFAGMSPEELYDITSASRSADAARGMLETGGSAGRETEARRKAIEARRQSNLGQIGALTSGYANLATPTIPGQPSPWGDIISKMSPYLIRALEDMQKKKGTASSPGAERAPIEDMLAR